MPLRYRWTKPRISAKIPAYRELTSCVKLLESEEFDRCVSQILRHHACQFVCFRIRVCQGKYIHFIPTNPLLKNHVSMHVSLKETRKSFDHDCTDHFWPCLVSIETVWATAKLLWVGSGWWNACFQPSGHYFSHSLPNCWLTSPVRFPRKVFLERYYDAKLTIFIFTDNWVVFSNAKFIITML